MKSREYAKCCKTRDSACSDNGNDDDGNAVSVKVQGTLSSMPQATAPPLWCDVRCGEVHS